MSRFPFSNVVKNARVVNFHLTSTKPLRQFGEYKCGEKEKTHERQTHYNKVKDDCENRRAELGCERSDGQPLICVCQPAPTPTEM